MTIIQKEAITDLTKPVFEKQKKVLQFKIFKENNNSIITIHLGLGLWLHVGSGGKIYVGEGDGPPPGSAAADDEGKPFLGTVYKRP